MLTTLSVIGTRPEAIKMAPVVRELQKHPDRIRSLVCSTGQHRQMLDQVLSLFNIQAGFELNVMQPNQTLSGLTARLLEKMDEVVTQTRPDWIIAQGDTTTVLVASLLAYYHRIPFGHVEAGLRTGDLYRPFPEEANRCVADLIGQLLFAPTEWSRQSLLREGVGEHRIRVTGNTVVDALKIVAGQPYDWTSGPLASVPRNKRLVLITAHRRESFGEPFEQLCQAISDLARRFEGDGVHFVYPVHLNPNVRKPVESILKGLQNLSLLEPLEYLPLVQLMKASTLILTDSGGIQEEAPGVGVPVLVMRDTTERPEGVQKGVAKLVGTTRDRIYDEAEKLLSDEQARLRMARIENPYGDGHAAQRIVSALLEHPTPKDLLR